MAGVCSSPKVSILFYDSTILVGRGLCLLFIEVSRSHSAGIPQDEGSACRREFYPQNIGIHARQAGFETAIPVNEWPETYALRPHGHWDRQLVILHDILISVKMM